MTTLRAAALAGLLAAVPDRVVAHALTHPVRGLPLVPASVRRAYDVDVSDVGAGRVATARPRTGGHGRHLFHLHGGAYTLGPAHWGMAKPFLDRGWTVSIVDYPLAPEHTVTTTVAMVVEAWQRAVAAQEPDLPVDLSGDSAGGGLALVLLQHVRDHELVPPGRTVLFSPWVDLVMDDPLVVEADRHDPFLSLAGLRGAARLYAGGLDLADPRLSPIRGDLAHLGAIQAWVGTREQFLPQCCALADRCAGLPGTELELRIGHGLVHDWPLLPVPEAARTLVAAEAFLR